MSRDDGPEPTSEFLRGFPFRTAALSEDPDGFVGHDDFQATRLSARQIMTMSCSERCPIVFVPAPPLNAVSMTSQHGVRRRGSSRLRTVGLFAGIGGLEL